MSEWLTEGLTIVLVSAGVFFYWSGTLGLLRLPDSYARLHALTKADNLGLGLVVSGLLFQAPDLWWAGKVLLVWLLALVASAVNAYFVAHLLRRKEREHG